MPSGTDRSSSQREAGTASVELVAVLPFLLLAVLAVAQTGLAGQALWSASVAARAGARASLIGDGVEVAARRALPPALRAGSEVERGRGVAVRVAVPTVLPGLPRVEVGARSGLGPEDG